VQKKVQNFKREISDHNNYMFNLSKAASGLQAGFPGGTCGTFQRSQRIPQTE